MENKEFLYEMLSTMSPGGCEIGLQKKVKSYLQGKVDEVDTDYAGNVYGIVNPDASLKVMMMGHIDEICLRVVGFDGSGFLKVEKTGGIRASQYMGHKVRVFNGKNVIYGSVVEKDVKEKMSASELRIDIGANSREDAMKYVKHGDWVVYDTDVRELLNDCVTARALDDRVGAFIVIEAAIKAKAMGCKVGVCALTSVGEETNSKGAYYAATKYQPDMAFAVDVTYASDYDGSMSGESGEVNLGGGAVLDRGVSLNHLMNLQLEKSAAAHNIPVQFELSSGRTGTDEGMMQYTNKGVPTALVSIPCRNMHSPAEVVSLKDVESCIDILAHFLCDIDENFNLDPFQGE